MFSVIVPVHNHSRYLEFGAFSALRSPLVREVLMVDDASTDDSPDRIRRLASAFPNRVRDLSEPGEENRGAHARLDQLVAEARCRWIAVLNSDDAFTAGRFDLIRTRLRCRPVDFVCGQLLIMNELGNTVGTKRGIEQPEFAFPDALGIRELAARHDLLPLLANQNFIATTSSMIFTKELYERVGGFRDLHYVHDWDFALRAAAVGRCEYVPQFLSLYRSHSHNTIKTHEAAIRAEVVRFFRDFERDFASACRRPEVALAMADNRYLRAGSG